MAMEPERFKQQLKALPSKAGVYLFRDAAGNVLYVGKAANLRSRVRSYFGAPHTLPPKIRRMMARVDDFELLVTDSDQEALILECNLIKKYHPRYNVRLKDDKTYPYLKINVNDDWARVYVTRRVERDGARYFGPFASAGSVRRALDLLQRLFQFRPCKRDISGASLRPCLEYDIHRCSGPCIGAVSGDEYREIIDQVIMFLEGRGDGVVRGLERKMDEASRRLEFERAAALRDQLHAVKAVLERQSISSTRGGDQDVLALAQDGDQAYVEVFFIRGGRLIERDHFIVQGARDEGVGQVMAGFVKQFYQAAAYVPPVVLLQHPPDDPEALELELSAKRGSKVSLRVPVRGERKRLVAMAAENARQGLEQVRAKAIAGQGDAAALDELKEALQLPSVPRRIEGYDISDIQGSAAVGGMVLFENGQPAKKGYRRFRIKAAAFPDDYAMMREVLRRRFKRAGGPSDDSWPLPDLVLIDGGRGHLNAALGVMAEMGVDSIPVASIAKENEELFRPGVAEPIILSPRSPALHLVQRIRDEAHRFAIGYHRKVRGKDAVSSALDNVSGIGPKRKRALLRRFGSVKGIREAEIDEIAAVVGMTRSLAQRVKEQL